MLQEAIDAKLMLLFNNIWTVSIESTTYTVKAMIMAPEEQIIKAQYPVPSIGIQFFDLLHSPEREYQKIIARDHFVNNVSPIPDTIDVRDAPIKYDFFYQIYLMSYYAQHDRTLTKNILKTLPPRGYISVIDTVPNPDETYNLWTFLEDFRQIDTQGQYRIFKKVFSYRILGWFDESTRVTKKTPSEELIIQTKLPKVSKSEDETLGTNDWTIVQ
jgi:hypothetical protein